MINKRARMICVEKQSSLSMFSLDLKIVLTCLVVFLIYFIMTNLYFELER